jgi:hypothetical protein
MHGHLCGVRLRDRAHAAPGARLLAGRCHVTPPRLRLIALRSGKSQGRQGGLISALAALAGGVWLVVAPSLHQVWSPSALAPQPAGAWHTAWLWIGYFYGPDALAIYLSARAQALSRRGAAYDSPAAEQPRRPRTQSTSPENEPASSGSRYPA